VRVDPHRTSPYSFPPDLLALLLASGFAGPDSDPEPLDYSKHIQKAEEAARRKNYDFAVQLFQQLLELDADQAEARAGLRRALKKRHEAKKGGKLLRAIGGAAPLAMAKTMRKAGKHKGAVKSLETYLATNPLDVDANLLLGMSCEDAGYFNSARVVYEFIAEIAPKNCEGLKRAGSMMQRAGEFQKALDYYQRALDVDPRDQDALKARKNLAAETALSDRDAKPAQHSRDQIVDKEQAVALERSRRRHLSEEDLKEDLERLEGLFAEDNKNTETMVRLAEVHEKLKDPAAALEFIERALSYDKDSVDLQQRASKLKLKSLKRALAQAGKAGDQEKADRLERELWEVEIESLRQRIQIHPGDASLRLELGGLLARSGEHDTAIAEFQKAVADPRLAREATCRLGASFQAKGFFDLARSEYEKALEGAPDADERSKEILYNLGAIAESEGDDAAARGFYSRVFGVDIGYLDVAQKMERLR
ncbi:MAG: tetratricopeptide repeat protein, partial [Planctomycetota bacterium]